jgi:phosphatidylinositol-4,5-bisphosphate 3-kinase catalytic subunit alpha/beta/delta
MCIKWAERTRQRAPCLLGLLKLCFYFRGRSVDACKVMESAMTPLWLEFCNEDRSHRPTRVIFKQGDDLRQDQLTIQLFSIMDSLWRKAGLDLRMTLYRCLPTSLDAGMIEV